jgi:predicted nucleic acid-binding protein
VIVVSDTTAITSLLKLGQLELLSSLFGEVTIPRAVQSELLSYHNALPSWLLVKAATDHEILRRLRQQLDVGEAEAIALAKEIDADMLVIDEKKGRLVAEGLELKCIGLAGVLLLAKQQSLISSLGGTLFRLESEANFYLATAVKRKLLIAANESPNGRNQNNPQ